MPLHVLRLRGKYHEVLRRVVSLIPVDMVNHLSRFQRASQKLLSHKSVLMATILLRVSDALPSVEAGSPQFRSNLWCHPPGVQLLV